MPKIIPKTPNRFPPTIIANKIHNEESPNEFPTTTGYTNLPSNCCIITIDTKNSITEDGFAINIINTDIIIPIYVPNIGIKFSIGIIILISIEYGILNNEKTIKNTLPSISPSVD